MSCCYNPGLDLDTAAWMSFNMRRFEREALEAEPIRPWRCCSELAPLVRLRLFRNHLAVSPDIDGSTMGTRGLAGGFRGATQGAANGHRKCFGVLPSVD